MDQIDKEECDNNWIPKNSSVEKHKTFRDDREFSVWLAWRIYVRKSSKTDSTEPNWRMSGNLQFLMICLMFIICLFTCLFSEGRGEKWKTNMFFKQINVTGIRNRSEQRPRTGRPARQVLKLSTPKTIRVWHRTFISLEVTVPCHFFLVSKYVPVIVLSLLLLTVLCLIISKGYTFIFHKVINNNLIMYFL